MSNEVGHMRQQVLDANTTVERARTTEAQLRKALQLAADMRLSVAEAPSSTYGVPASMVMCTPRERAPRRVRKPSANAEHVWRGGQSFCVGARGAGRGARLARGQVAAASVSGSQRRSCTPSVVVSTGLRRSHRTDFSPLSFCRVLGPLS